jgi:protein associated with RNAse G/E
MIIGKGSQNTIFLEEAIKLLLQNSQDSEKLTRQSNWWKKRKDKWFNLIGNQ